MVWNRVGVAGERVVPAAGYQAHDTFFARDDRRSSASSDWGTRFATATVAGCGALTVKEVLTT